MFLGATPKSAPMKATNGWYATVTCPSARILTGIGPVAVRAPRVRDRTGLGGRAARWLKRDLSARLEDDAQCLLVIIDATREGKKELVDLRWRGLAMGPELAVADGALGFQLVPWSPSLEKHLGRDVTGVARGDSGVDWDFGRKRGLGL